MRRPLLVAVVFAIGTATVLTMPPTHPKPAEPDPRPSDSPTTTPTAIAQHAANVESSPAETPAPSREAQVARLYVNCVADTKTPLGQIASGARGRSVAVIGDSITTQIRERLTNDPARRWVVWSRCGATVQTALDADAAAHIRAEHPDVVVVALGTNDAGFPSPTPGSSEGFEGRARRLVAQLVGVPCVVWVDAAAVGDELLQSEMDRVNAVLRGSEVRVVEWSRAVASDPGLLLDRVHLSAEGVQRRIKLVADAVNGCTTVAQHPQPHVPSLSRHAAQFKAR